LKITIVGIGYVGLSISVLLARNNSVVALDICSKKVDKINSKKSPLIDKDITKYLAESKLDLKATSNTDEAYKNADFIIIATPTDYDPKTNQFDTRSIEKILKKTDEIKNNATVVIKSTVPVGFTDSMQKKYNGREILFSPEFLREGSALHDNLYPSRIILGGKSENAKVFAKMLQKGAIKKNIDTLFIKAREAEAIKLFSNTYLAMRVAFFNELDSFSMINKLDTKAIIDGVCLDPRIDKHYNNPSFGYGGYCLPKDTKQLLANYSDVPHTLIEAIVTSNSIRKDFISDEITKLNPKVVGIYRLVMKTGSDNIRTSSIQGIIRRLRERDIMVIIYEPMLDKNVFFGSKLVNDIRDFKSQSSIIITNRMGVDLEDVKEKVFTRDITGEN
tara:strand:+ start:98 stop:1264 length:1167 start_codon:yes stop_codon:yes gene_type:complete